jgi:cytoskeletal protein CcmA (bactofilin family)
MFGFSRRKNVAPQHPGGQQRVAPDTNLPSSTDAYHIDLKRENSKLTIHEPTDKETDPLTTTLSNAPPSSAGATVQRQVAPPASPSPVAAPLAARPAQQSIPPAPPTAGAPAAPRPEAAPVASAHLHAGPGIRIKGDISGCETLRIEGDIDGTVTAGQVVICTGGSFLGTMNVDHAEITGGFDGTLNVRGQLVVRSGGSVAGTVRYGQMEVERGGDITGDIARAASSATQAAKSPTAAAPSARELEAAKRVLQEVSANASPSKLGRWVPR